MAFSMRDVEAYRRDAKLGGKLLTPEDRIRIAKPYLPPPRTSIPVDANSRGKKPRFGVRARGFLKKQFHMLVFVLIHTFFSLYLKFRHGYHAIQNRFYSIFRYHHRDPSLIQSDVKRFRKLPKHLSVVLTLENDGTGGAGLERLINEAAEIAAWCASAGIPQLSIYEKTGILKGYMPETHRAISQKLVGYFPQPPSLSLGAPHLPAVESSRPGPVNSGFLSHLSLQLLSAEDGRDSIVDLTKTLADMAQRSKLSSPDISTDLLDNELSVSVMGEPDLLILFGPHVELSGYPPWQIRLTEIFHVQDNSDVEYHVFHRALASFAGAQMQGIMAGFLRPPVVRSGAAALNKALFSKKLDLAAATIQDPRLIAKYRKALSESRELLRQERISPIVSHPEDVKTGGASGRKCLLLAPTVNPQVPGTWGPVLKEAVEKKDLDVIPYELELGYDHWSHVDIMTSILPEDLHDDIPAGFNMAGHVAHLNLRERYLPYKKIIAQVLLDKNPQIRTVINKVDTVGSESEFRTFQYEVLAGPDDMDVSVSESGCTFEFNYAKVYWNSKLEHEHARLVDMFQPGEVVCDVMAGIGPFAVPAGKKGVIVWANDMNPESHFYLKKAIEKNKVTPFVRPFCDDGRFFIHKAADSVLAASQAGENIVIPAPRPKRKNGVTPLTPEPKRIPIPPTISHFVMNLPATAIEFLGHYRGIYAGHEDLFAPHTEAKLPMVHVHCFSFKADDDTPIVDICERITKYLGFEVKHGDPEREGEVAIHDVRNVSPSKRMFCASFRIPREVAFAARS
ncbi:putative undecaprenyl pyrophosphate protein [Rhypophila decipiens]